MGKVIAVGCKAEIEAQMSEMEPVPGQQQRWVVSG